MKWRRLSLRSRKKKKDELYVDMWLMEMRIKALINILDKESKNAA